MRNDMNCEAIQRAVRERRELTKDELAHMDECDACMDVWLTMALDGKPEVAIPEGFAAQVAAMAPARQGKSKTARTRQRWGLVTAVAMVTVLLAVWFAGPAPTNSWIGVVFVMLVASEIAGLALWLGPGWTGR